MHRTLPPRPAAAQRHIVGQVSVPHTLVSRLAACWAQATLHACSVPAANWRSLRLQLQLNADVQHDTLPFVSFVAAYAPE